MDRRCALRLTRRYDTSPAQVWQALTEPESLARWLGAVDVRVREVEPGRVLELELKDALARIELASEGEGTLLVLDHQEIPAAIGMRFARYWTAALERFELEVAA